MIKDRFPTSKNEKEFSAFKDNLRGKIMKKFAGPRGLMFKNLHV